MSDKLEWRIAKQLLNSTILVMIISISISIIGSVIDSIFIGNFLGSVALGAYGIISPIFLIFAVIGGILSSGAQALMTPLISKGKRLEISGIFTLTTLVAIIIAMLLVLIVVFFPMHVSFFFGASDFSNDLNKMSSEYLIGYAPGIPFIIIMEYWAAIMQIDNDRSRTIVAIFVMLIVDVALDAISVMVFDFGILGIALATSISYWAAFIVMIFHFRKKDCSIHFKLKLIVWKNLCRILKIGFPSGVSRLSTAAKIICINWLFSFLLADYAITAFSVQNNLYNIILAISNGVSASVLLTSGIFYGDKDIHHMVNIIKIGTHENLFLTTVVSIICFIFAPYIASIFVEGTLMVLDETIFAIRTLCLFAPFSCILMTYISFLEGTQNYKFANIIVTLSGFIFPCLFAYILGLIFGTTGVWVSLPFSSFISLLFIFSWNSIKQRKLCFSIRDSLMLPDNFYIDEKYIFDAFYRSKSEINDICIRLKKLFINNKINNNVSNFLLSAVKNLSQEIINHVFIKAKKKYAINLRVVIVSDKILLRFIDNGENMSPNKWAEVVNKYYESYKSEKIDREKISVKFENVMGINWFVLSINI